MSDHYFSAAPSSASRERTVSLALPDATISLVSDRGMFSPNHIDPGTKYLLQTGAQPGPGARNVADIGCGYGAIACTVARRAPDATVWAVDVNERAVELCRRNAETLGFDNVRVALEDPAAPGASLPDDVRLDAIYANPPIRIGKEALHQLLQAWLGRLAPDGHAELVVQKHLGADSLQRWLTDEGYPAERLGSRSGYRILRVTRP